jgi:hypothetical protein
MQRLLTTAWCVALGIALMVGSPLTLQGSGVRSPLTLQGSGIGSPLTPSLSPLPKEGEGAGSGGIQTPAQRALIAILQSGEGSLYDQAVQGFKTEMARRGYREGSTVEYLVLTLKATGKEEPVESLLKRSPKVVVAVGTDAAHIPQRAIRPPTSRTPASCGLPDGAGPRGGGAHRERGA